MVTSKHNHQTFTLIMMIITITLITTILLPKIDACSCLANVNQPQYCNTDFFALLHITDEKMDEKSMNLVYHFQPLSIINDKQRLLNTYRTLHTYASSAACGIKLKPGDRYLIGGNLDRENDRNRLLLHLCSSYVEHYVRGMAVLTKDFHSLLQNCRSFDDKTTSVMIDNEVGNKEIESVDHQQRNNTNHQLEREGTPIINFPQWGLTEDDIIQRRSRRRQQRKNYKSQ
ncbi:hypothetical protein DERP_008397 [Dermatophagoides pteronyssinus]|uniref:NTR domain-containing protein n=1 Tax=Dermatophagoides pteronyssinus TaxID=6956 RepID=A0ABQ8IV54_DERPT|nr:hypothetical protein DERP_008397 [Dermatophagoides pteronyssinus]